MTRIGGVTPERLRLSGNVFKEAASQSVELLARLERTINTLPKWRGLTTERFYQDFLQSQAPLRQCVDLLYGIARQLHAIADRFEAVDQM